MLPHGQRSVASPRRTIDPSGAAHAEVDERRARPADPFGDRAVRGLADLAGAVAVGGDGAGDRAG